MSIFALSVSDLSKKYGQQQALSHATFEVSFGTVCGFVGPNGSGKTTTMRMLLGLITPTGGNAHVLGEPISHPERYLDRVGAMIEGPAFYPALSGAENLRFLATLGGLATSQIPELLERVGLGERAESKYKTYSLGMKQRLGIAAALLPNPQLLLLDEPTNGLDPAGIQEIRELLRSLADDGTTVFLSSHLLSEIEMISDSLVMLRKGEVVFAGKTQELLLQQQPTILAKSADPKDLPRLLEIAHQAGHEGSVIGEVAHILGPTEWAGTLNRLAFDSGIILIQLEPMLPTLEETFFEMTGEI
ncbi:MAG: ATP-binding cassette domain-containing protein [Actinobacteria bacterium]|nr:ATP-binding cassette domain-containing protein [Actinomycetota bacterium]